MTVLSALSSSTVGDRVGRFGRAVGPRAAS